MYIIKPPFDTYHNCLEISIHYNKRIAKNNKFNINNSCNNNSNYNNNNNNNIKKKYDIKNTSFPYLNNSRKYWLDCES